MTALYEGDQPPGPPSPTAPADWAQIAVRTAHVAFGVASLPDGRFVDVNDAFCRLSGWPRNHMIGRSALELGLWADEAQRERMFALLRRQGSVSGYEAGFRMRTGELLRTEFSATIIERHGGRYLVGFLTEVSAQHEMLQGLQAAQGRLGVALRATGLLVFRQDPELRYTWIANPALGATEADLIGRTDADIIGAEAAAPLVSIKRRVLLTGKPERRDVWVGNNGQLGCFDLVVEPERDASGRVVAIVCAAQDITARMLAGDEALANDRARQAIEGMASLIGLEDLSERQRERLDAITARAGRLGRRPDAEAPDDAGGALERLREHHPGRLVVVAEHNPVVRELFAALLEGAGLRVALAASGVEAFGMSLRLDPALLLVDMELPQRGGVAAARAVRAMLPRRIPIVAMVSADPLAGMAPALDADLDDVLAKPVVADRLYAKVLAWLQA